MLTEKQETVKERIKKRIADRMRDNFVSDTGDGYTSPIELQIIVDEEFDSLVSELQKRIKFLEKSKKKDPEKCHICGARLELGSSGNGLRSFYCSASKYIGGTKEEQKHFNDSRVELWAVPNWRIDDRIEELKRVLGLVEVPCRESKISCNKTNMEKGR